MSAASLVTLPPRAFRSLLHATDPAVCRPRCEPVRPRHPIAPRCDQFHPCDVVDCCGLLLNQALREIDLLRSGLQNAGALRASDHVTNVGPSDACSSSPTGSLDRAHRPNYAVRPIGDIPMKQHTQSPIVATQQAIIVQVVTNLGTLLDVLT